MGLLIARFQYFDCWTLGVSLGKRGWPDKGVDLKGQPATGNIIQLGRRAWLARVPCPSGFMSLQ